MLRLTTVIFFMMAENYIEHKTRGMKNIKPGAGFTIFILFFGVALLDAIASQHWLRVMFWVFIGVAFLLFENMGQRKKSKSDS